MDDEFKLCWKNFQDNIASGFQNLYDRGDLVDVTLACDGKLLHAHKIVLAICSPYFQEIFITNPCKHPIIILKDVTFNIMCELLEFMYQGVVNVKHTELQSFMKIGQLLQIKGLATSGSAAAASTNDNKISANNKNNDTTQEITENEGNNSPKNSDNASNNNNNNNTNNDNDNNAKNEEEEEGENSNSNNNNNNKSTARSPATSPTPMIFGSNFKHFNDNNLSLSLSSYSQSQHHHHPHQLRHHHHHHHNHHQIGGSMKRQYSSLSEYGGGGGDGGLSIYSRNKLRKSLSIADQSSSCGGENDATSAASSDIGGNNTATLHSSTTNISHNNNNNNSTSMEQVNVEDIFLSAMPHIPIIDSKYDLSGVKRESGGNNNNNNNDASTSRNSFANNPYGFDYNLYKNNNNSASTTTTSASTTSTTTANTTEYPNELHMPNDYSKNFGNHMDIPAIAPGEHWFQGKLEFMLSQRGKPLLVHDGHTFGIQYVRKDKKYWQCNLSRKFNCKARVTTTDTGEIIVTNNEHCHTEIRQHLRKDYQRNKVMMNALLNLSSMRRHSVGNLSSLGNLKQCLPSMLAVAEHCSEPSILDLAKASSATTTSTENIDTRNSPTNDYTAHDLSRTATKMENEYMERHEDDDEDSDNDSPLDCGMRGTSASDF